MKKLARLLLVVLVALTVPLQGALAVTTGQCMALEHHDGAGHHHGDDQASPHSHADTDDSGSSASHCGPCTACCASTSISGPAKLEIYAAPQFAITLLPQYPPLGLLPSELERPPLAL